MPDESSAAAPASAPSPAPVPAAALSPTDAVVEQWFSETFHNLPLDTSLYNRFYAAKGELQQRLRAVLTQKE